MQGWTDILVVRLAIISVHSIKEKSNQENISMKKHSTAFAQVSVLLRFEQQDW